MANDIVLFGLNGSAPYAAKIARKCDIPLSPHTFKRFEDEESYLKSEVNVRGKDVYVVSGLYSDEKQTVNDKVVNLLWFIGSLKDASARRVTAVIPYLAYSRQDRKDKSRAPVTTRYLAQTLEAVGLDRVITMDVHNLSAFNNSFRIPVDNIDTIKIFSQYLCGGVDKDNLPVTKHIEDPLINDPKNLVVLAPDIGGLGRCGNFQAGLETILKCKVGLAVYDKRRVDGEVKGTAIVGDVKGKRVIVYDDMIGTGSTIKKSTDAAEEAGGTIFAVCATHGLFTGQAETNLNKIQRLVVTDSLPPWRLKNREKLRIVSTVRTMQLCIKRSNEEGGSISDLLSI